MDADWIERQWQREDRGNEIARRVFNYGDDSKQAQEDFDFFDKKLSLEEFIIECPLRNFVPGSNLARARVLTNAAQQLAHGMLFNSSLP